MAAQVDRRHVEQVEGAAERQPERLCDALGRREGAGITVGQRRDEGVDVGLAGLAQQRVRARDRFQAADGAAPTVLAAGIDAEVAELARPAVPAGQQPPVQRDRRADAHLAGHVDERRPRLLPQHRQGGTVDVVGRAQPDRRVVDRKGPEVDDVQALPLGEVRCAQHGPAEAVHQSREGERGPREPTPGRHRGQRLPGEVGELPHRVLWGERRDVDLAAGDREQFPGEVDDGGHEALDVDLEAQRVDGPAADGERHGGAAAPAADRGPLLDDVARDEVVDQAGDGRAGHAQLRRDVGPRRRRALVQDLTEDEGEVRRPHRRLRQARGRAGRAGPGGSSLRIGTTGLHLVVTVNHVPIMPDVGVDSAHLVKYVVNNNKSGRGCPRDSIEKRLC